METSFKFSGEPTVEALATGLATLGRYGDDRMIHASEGETLIPAEVFAANPDLKEKLFAQMRMMGVANPERFVVGNALNSLNPITGQPEFFFKKIFKGVGKVFKKALPIIAPILGNLIAPGIGGLIASALVTKLQGGSWGDVLKGAAISWATQGLTSGIGSSISGGGFLEGVGKGLTAPFTAASNIFSSGAANPFSQGIFGTAGAVSGSGLGGAYRKVFPTYNPNAQLASQLPQNLAAGAVRTDPFGQQTQIGGEALTMPSTFTTPSGAEISDFGGTVQRFGIPSPAAQSNIAEWNRDLSPVTFDAPAPRLANIAVDDAEGWKNLARFENLGPTSLKAQGHLPPPRTWNPETPSRVIRTGTMPSTFTTPSGAEISDIGGKGIPVTAVEAGAFGPAPASQLPLGQKVTLADGNIWEVVKSPVEIDPVSGLQTGGGSQTFAKVPPPRGLLDLGIAGRVREAGQYLGVPESADYIADYVGPLATTGALTAASGLLSEDPQPPPRESPVFEAYDRWQTLEDKDSDEAIELFYEWNGAPHVTRSDYERRIGAPLGSTRDRFPDWRFLPESSTATEVARGGEIVGPGTGTSDSIPARLSDGEFVMTADAVRNAGGGDRNLGAARMYDMMRRFEGGTA